MCLWSSFSSNLLCCCSADQFYMTLVTCLMQVVNRELQQFFLISKPGPPLQQLIDRLTCISWCWSKVHLSPATRMLLDMTKPITITDTIASHLAILLLSVVPQCMLSPWFNWSRGETMSERSGDGDSDATSQYVPSHVNWSVLYTRIRDRLRRDRGSETGGTGCAQVGVWRQTAERARAEQLVGRRSPPQCLAAPIAGQGSRVFYFYFALT